MIWTVGILVLRKQRSLCLQLWNLLSVGNDSNVHSVSNVSLKAHLARLYRISVLVCTDFQKLFFPRLGWGSVFVLSISLVCFQPHFVLGTEQLQAEQRVKWTDRHFNGIIFRHLLHRRFWVVSKSSPLLKHRKGNCKTEGGHCFYGASK